MTRRRVSLRTGERGDVATSFCEEREKVNFAV